MRKFQAVMFHHFHDSNMHRKSQGSISADQFRDMIVWLKTRYSVLNASEYLLKLEKRTLQDHEICLTFDDALLCQSDVALPVLREMHLNAFFFIYTSPMMGHPDPLEVYRYFRHEAFDSLDDFYSAFFTAVQTKFPDRYQTATCAFSAETYLSAFSFYTKSDKWFRYLRDETLGPALYRDLMTEMIEERHFSVSEISERLWMTDNDLRTLYDQGHLVGLHSHTHPTRIQSLSEADQHAEYRTNFDYLKKVTGAGPVSMSHPCGNYNDATLHLLKVLGIKIGFRSNPTPGFVKSDLEIPRLDHATVLKEMTT